ncbi:MAG TPA: hypothetical protein VN018_06235, partial [Brevundimonas sp.]|nr:hypothetical protein [Brevundimonas sp.]
MLRRADQPVVTICGGRSGQPDQVFSGLRLHHAALERGAALTAFRKPEDGPLALVMPCGADFV